MKKIDVCGLNCPKPLIIAKNELKNGENFEMISDNEISKNNLIKFLSDNNVKTNISEKDNKWFIKIEIGDKINIEDDVEAYCEIGTTDIGNFIIVIDSNKMGKGDDNLGEILLNGYISTIGELEKIPTHIIFYNSGVKTCIDNNISLANLKNLEQRGVKIIVCGTCVDFFHLKDKIHIGDISNMYVISTLLHEASKIINI